LRAAMVAEIGHIQLYGNRRGVSPSEPFLHAVKML
jgi:hypothetical protein